MRCIKAANQLTSLSYCMLNNFLLKSDISGYDLATPPSSQPVFRSPGSSDNLLGLSLDDGGSKEKQLAVSSNNFSLIKIW